MKTARQLLQEKSAALYVVRPEATVYQALQALAEKDVGALLVMEGARLVGIFSERDYARKVVLQGKTSASTPIRDVMTTGVIYATPDQTVDQCMAVMTDKHIRHLPVMDGDLVMGLLSIGDLVKETLDQQEFTIQQLVHYIYR